MSQDYRERSAVDGGESTGTAGSPGKRALTDRMVQRKAVSASAPATEASVGREAGAAVDDPFDFLDGPAPIQAKAAAAPPVAEAAPAIQLKDAAIWLKAFHDEASPDAVPAEALSASGGGAAMPGPVQAKMERAFGTDLSAVRIHEGEQAASIGAAAYTQGTDLHFAPGQYDPHSERGQELLGHELTHVVQQSQGRVPVGAQAKGAVTVNSDAGLEHEADVMGARAARGEPVAGGGAAVGPAAGAIQRKAEGAPAGGAAAGAGPAAAGGAAAGGDVAASASREPTAEELEQLYPRDGFTPVALSAFQSKVVQPAYIARRPLSMLPWMIGPAYHEHIFFEDGGAPPNIGFMGKGGLGQDATGGYTRTRAGLDDARMRQAVAQVGPPGEYALLGNNCQAYVARVLAAYAQLGAGH